jgi:hypothetical protein
LAIYKCSNFLFQVKSQLQDVMENLNKEFEKGTYGVKRSPSHVSTISNRSSKSNENSPSLSKFYNVHSPDNEHVGDSDSNTASSKYCDTSHGLQLIIQG